MDEALALELRKLRILAEAAQEAADAAQSAADKAQATADSAGGGGGGGSSGVAVATLSANQTGISGFSQTVIELDTATEIDGLEWQAGSHSYKATRELHLLAIAGIQIDNMTSGYRMDTIIQKYDGTWADLTRASGHGNDTDCLTQTSAPVTLAVDDQLRLQVWHHLLSSLTVLANDPYTFLRISEI